MQLPFLLIVVILLSACAGIQRPSLEPLHGSPRDQACVAFFQALDAVVLAHGVRDGAAPPVPGYPWFRSSRLIQAMEPALDGADLAAALLAEDQHVRAMELRNVPAAAADGLTNNLEHQDAGSAVAACGERLAARLLADDPALTAVRPGAAIADDYISWHRWAGLYPLSRFGILAGVGVWQRGTRAEFQAHADLGSPGLRFIPAAGREVTPTATVRKLLTMAQRDALGRLQLDATERDQLLMAYAPIIELEQAAGHNRLGAPLWEQAGQPNVNVAVPVVYTTLSHTRFDDQTLLQLNYVFWFSSRPKKHPLDILGGRLDGVTVRLTLDTAGEPILLETMHNCGCYHQFYPLGALKPLDRPHYAEPPLILASPGAPQAGERLVLRLKDGSHYVARLFRADAQPAAGQTYVLEDYDHLRSLPLQDQRRSLFSDNGLVAGTRRDEQVLFWVSGVPAPGAMRQMGRHVTAFVGRRHFDDPDLLDRIFTPMTR